MGFTHSKKTVIIIDGNDVSIYCTDSQVEKSVGTEDNTTYGKDDVVKDPTLKTGVFTCSGKYHDSVAGPRRVLYPLVGTKVTVKHRGEGTGAGLPQDQFDAVITKYTETAPTAGYRLWALETEPSDAWIVTPQTT